MHILYICADWEVNVLGRAGSSVHVQQICKAFASLGHQVTLCCVNAQGRAALPERLQLHTFTPRLRLRERLGPWLRGIRTDADKSPAQPASTDGSRLAGPLRSVGTAVDYATRKVRLWQFRRMVLGALGDSPVNLVYERASLFSLAGPKLARVLDAPAIVEFNTPFAIELPERGRLFRKAIVDWEGQLLLSCDAAVCVSGQLAEHLADQHPSAAPKLHIVPNGVDPEQFDPKVASSSLRSRLGLGNKTVVGFVGSMKAWHDLTTVISAIEMAGTDVADLCLLAVGEGPRRSEFERQSQLCGVDAVFVGAVDHEQIPEYISVMDIAVAPHPQLATFYFSPIKIFEYMCMARPVIASNIGQLQEAIEHGVTGILVGPEDPAVLAEAIVVLAQSPPLRQRLGQAAYDWVSRSRTWEKTAQQVLSMAERFMA